MNRNILKVLLATLLITLLQMPCLAEITVKKSFVPMEQVMPVSAIKKGMTGYLKTVLSGSEISKHTICIEGVIERKTSPKKLILVKITDNTLLEAGGAAAGMSGSPVYVDGKLIGAFAYAWSFADKSLGLVTPIDEMCRSMDRQDIIPPFIKTKYPEDDDFLAVDNYTPVRSIISVDNNKEEETVTPDRDAPPPVLIEDFEKIRKKPEHSPFLLMDDVSLDIEQLKNAEIVPLSFILQADGIEENSIKQLENKLGTKIIPLAATSDVNNGVTLNKRMQPGASMGVVLAWGDISLGGIGTLTAVDKDGRFLAFGHPMLKRGAVAMPLTESKIIRIIPNMQQAFKLGSIGNITGIVTQDRPEAIGGYFGQLPPCVSYDVLIHDLDDNRVKAKRFRTIADPYLSPELGQAGVLSILESEWARKGEGTLMIRFGINGGGLKETWERRDIFFSSENALEPVEKSMKLLTSIFALNRFDDITPLGIELEVLLTRIPRIAVIDSLKIIDEKEFYEPGDVIKLEVAIRPWRKEPILKKIALRVPKDAEGICEIDVRAGCIEPQKEDAVLRGLAQITSLESLLQELSVQETNNMLIAEIGGPEMPAEKKKKHDSTLGKMNQKRDGNDEDDKGGKDAEYNDKIDKKESDKDSVKLPRFLTDTRLMSEIQKERLEEGSLRILDTNYYMDGIQRKFIKIRKSGKEGMKELEEFLKILEKAVKEELETSSNKSRTDSEEPAVQYFKNSERESFKKQ